MRKYIFSIIVALCSLFCLFPQTAMAASNINISVTKSDLNKQYFIMLQPNVLANVNIKFSDATDVEFSLGKETSFLSKRMFPLVAYEQSISQYSESRKTHATGEGSINTLAFTGYPEAGVNTLGDYNEVIADVTTSTGYGTVGFVFLCADWYSNASVNLVGGVLTGLGRKDNFPTAYKIGSGSWVYENTNNTITLPTNLSPSDKIYVGWPKNYSLSGVGSLQKEFKTNMSSRYTMFAIRKYAKPPLGSIVIYEPDNQTASSLKEEQDDSGDDEDEEDDDEWGDDDEEGDMEDEEEEDPFGEEVESTTPSKTGYYPAWFKLDQTCEYYIGKDPANTANVWKPGSYDVIKEQALYNDHIYIRRAGSNGFLASDYVDAGIVAKRHTWSTAWYSNSNSHWKQSTCIHAGLIAERTLHTFGSEIVTKAPTTKATGTGISTCKVCGYKKARVIPKVVKKAVVKKASSKTSSAAAAAVSLSVSQKKVTKSSISIKWNAISGASGYTVYGAKGKGKFKKLGTVNALAYTQKKLKKNTYYRYYVAAIKAGRVAYKSNTVYIATNGGKNGNYSKVSFSKKKLSIKKGKKARLKGKAKTPKKKKVKKYAGLKYTSSNKSIATVSSKGVITAKKKGKCIITVRTQNGKKASVTVTVK